MSDTDVLDAPPPGDAPPEVTLTAVGDPTPPTASPLILNDAYFELMGVNLRCLVQHLEVSPENKPVTVTSFCAETDYPGVTKWHLRVTFYQSFDVGATYQTLQAAYNAYVASGTPVNFKARPYSSRVAAANNPIISGFAIPQPFDIITGDAGAASQVQIDWNLTADPSVDTGQVAATGVTAGAPRLLHPVGGVGARQHGRPGRTDRLPGHSLDHRSVRHHWRPARRALDRLGLGGWRSLMAGAPRPSRSSGYGLSPATWPRPPIPAPGRS